MLPSCQHPGAKSWNTSLNQNAYPTAALSIANPLYLHFLTLWQTRLLLNTSTSDAHFSPKVVMGRAIPRTSGCLHQLPLQYVLLNASSCSFKRGKKENIIQILALLHADISKKKISTEKYYSDMGKGNKCINILYKTVGSCLFCTIFIRKDVHWFLALFSVHSE